MMFNLYTKTIFTYLLVGLVFFLSFYLNTPFVFLGFIVLVVIFSNGKALVVITRDEFTPKYVLFNLMCLVIVVILLFLALNATIIK